MTEVVSGDPLLFTPLVQYRVRVCVARSGLVRIKEPSGSPTCLLSPDACSVPFTRPRFRLVNRGAPLSFCSVQNPPLCRSSLWQFIHGLTLTASRNCHKPIVSLGDFRQGCCRKPPGSARLFQSRVQCETRDVHTVVPLPPFVSFRPSNAAHAR